MKTAKFIRDLEEWIGDARLYKLSEAIPYEGLGDWPDSTTEFVVVSAVVVPYGGPETYIFPALEDGQVMNHLELEGSFQGSLDHNKALLGAGYEAEE